MDFFETSSNESFYSCPGLYSVYCVITQNGFFGQSDNIYASLCTIYCQLLSGVFENRTLQNEFNLYEEDCFRFDPVAWGPEFRDPLVRQKKLAELNQL